MEVYPLESRHYLAHVEASLLLRQRPLHDIPGSIDVIHSSDGGRYVCTCMCVHTFYHNRSIVESAANGKKRIAYEQRCYNMVLASHPMYIYPTNRGIENYQPTCTRLFCFFYPLQWLTPEFSGNFPNHPKPTHTQISQQTTSQKTRSNHKLTSRAISSPLRRKNP